LIFKKYGVEDIILVITYIACVCECCRQGEPQML